MQEVSTPELMRERVKLTRAMLEHPAWKLLVRDWEEEIESLKHQLVYQPVNVDELRGFWRGKLDVLERFVNLPKILDAMEASLEDVGSEDE